MSVSALTKEQIEKSLKELNGWSFDSNAIHKKLQFDDFKQAMSFLVLVGFEAESAAHHPEIKNVYNKVEISLSTHDAGNMVTLKDIELAKRIDKLAK
jgi:4a-hydroxytetrahydrobiopterin dehydratase